MHLRHVSKFPFIAGVMCVAASASLAACGDASAPGALSGVGAEELVAVGEQALSAPLDIDPQRSLILTKVTDPMAMTRFPLDFVLNQLIMRAGTGGQQDALSLYRRWWDFFNTRNPNDDAPAQFLDAQHCDDNVNSAGEALVGGFPIQCPRREGRLAASDPFDPSSPDFMEPLAVVNRFDLAPLDGSHCGEYRIIYGKKTAGFADRNLIIVEAQLPNPHPECGLDACLPVAEFWANLSTLNGADRANALETFFTVGLVDAGFGPVLHPDNFADAVHGPAGHRGTGQIRTNQFMGAPGAPRTIQDDQVWQLHDFKLVKVFDGFAGEPRLVFKPVAVKENPFGKLFSPNLDNDPVKNWFMNDFIESVDKLTPLSSDINDIQLKGSTQDVYNAGQSSADDSNNYQVQLTNNFDLRARIGAELVRLGKNGIFSADDVANRATTQSCAGCHRLSSGVSLGNGVTWPAQGTTFTHVDESGTLSTTLTGHFLKHRETVLEAYLAEHADGSTCAPAAALAAPPSADSDEPVPTLGGSTTH
ncbi:hypothetical protein WME89_05225 [Sorangium sp. So ce321]|uniref:hypothetical protein n=1 Tax=Sorangium sp. So ce321 TaxID=3133300 RepID=UPI003F5E6A5C